MLVGPQTSDRGDRVLRQPLNIHTYRHKYLYFVRVTWLVRSYCLISSASLSSVGLLMKNAPRSRSFCNSLMVSASSTLNSIVLCTTLVLRQPLALIPNRMVDKAKRIANGKTVHVVIFCLCFIIVSVASCFAADSGKQVAPSYIIEVIIL